MLDKVVRHDRRRTDGDGQDAKRAAHRHIAQLAYELFVDAGRDPRRQAECWQQAEAVVLRSYETSQP